MKKNSSSSHSYVFTICNSLFFLLGIVGLLWQNVYLTSTSILTLSLLFLIYRLLQPGTDESEPVKLPITTEDEDDINKMQLALKVQELTETNEQLTLKLSQLEESLENEQNKTPAISSFYSCPLTVSIPYDAAAYVKDYVNDKANIINQRNIKLSYHNISEGVKINLSTAALQIVLDNLFDNILKFTPTGGSLYIRLCLKEPERLLMIFRNSGKPILDSDAGKIFDLHFQSINHLLGTGLGLAQVKAIITDFGGTVWTNDTNETGFTLYMELPTYSVK